MGLKHRRMAVVEELEQRKLLSLVFGSTSAVADTGMLLLNGQAQSADIDGDGKADLVVGTNASGSTLSLTGIDILLSNGSGGYTKVGGPPFPSSYTTASNAFAVLNWGNGKNDLVLASEDPNTLGGVITPETNESTVGTAVFSAGAAIDIANPTSFNPQSVVAGDFNGDGKMDLAVLGLSGPSGETLVILTGNGSGGFTEAATTYAVADFDGRLVTGDFNGDGKLDIGVYSPTSGNLNVFLNSSSGSTVVFTAVSTAFAMAVTGYTAGPVATGDFTSDGKTDVVVGENSSTGDEVVLFVAGLDSTGALTLTAQNGTPAGNPTDNQIGALAVGDFNSDGHLDVAEDYGVMLGDGAGNLSSPTTALNSSLLADTSGFDAMVASDVNGDGKLDVTGFEQHGAGVFSSLNISTAGALASSTVGLVADHLAVISGASPLLTATVASGAGTPSGYVEFFEGTTLLATELLGTGGTAQYTDTTPAEGTHSLSVKYLGDGAFAGSSSATLTVTVLPPPASASSLVPSLTSAKLPTALVAGARVNLVVPVVITNTAASKNVGGITLTLYASTVATIDGTQTQLGTALVVKNFPLRAGRPAIERIRVLTLPSALVGEEYLIARVTDATTASSDTATTSTIDIAAPFISLTTTVTKLTIAANSVSGAKTTGVVALTITNSGNVEAIGPATLGLYVTTDTTTEAELASIRTVPFTARIPAGRSLPLREKLLTLPVVQNGNYYLDVHTTDPKNVETTAFSTNTFNLAAPFVTLGLTVGQVGPTKVLPGGIEAVVFTITDNGNIGVNGPVSITIDPSIDGSTAVAGVTLYSESPGLRILPGVTKTIIEHFRVPTSLGINYYLPLVSISYESATAELVGNDSFAVI